MNICIATPTLHAYSETFITAQIERLHDVSLVVYGGAYPSLYDTGVPILPVPRGLFKRAALFAELRVLRKSLRQLEERSLVRLLQSRRIDVVLAQYGFIGVNLMDACREAGIPLVVHFHGFDAHRADMTKMHWEKYRELGQNAAAFIAVSLHMRDALIAQEFPAEKIHVRPYGVDCSRISAADFTSNPLQFSSVGRFVDKKAPYLTLLAFAQVCKKLQQAKLVMAGDGPLKETCMNIVSALGIADCVEFLGACSHEKVLETMAGSRAFVQHSLCPLVGDTKGDCEGTPVAILEASASGLPVISTRHAGIQEAVIDGKTGLLSAERDVGTMAKHMLQVGSDAALAAEIGKAGRQHMEANYSMESYISTVERILQSCG